MLEKMSSDLLSAKLDSLLTIAAGCETFGVEGLRTYLQALWMAIRNEIFQSVSQEVEVAGVQCLTAMSKALSPSMLPGGGRGRGGGIELKEFTEMVLKDCGRHLVEPDLKLLAPASRMLQAVAVGCDQACTAITAASLPQLLDQFHSRSMASQKKALLRVVLEFINIVKVFSKKDVSSPLDPHKSALISLLVPVIRGREQSLVEAGLDLCCALLSLPSYLENKEVELLVEHVKQLALSHSDTSVRERAPQCLECAALCHPLVVRESILPSMLQLFTLDTPFQMETDQKPPSSTHPEPTSLPIIAHLIASLSTDLDLQTLTLPSLLSVLEQLAERSFTQECVDLTEAVSSSVCSVVERTVSTPEGVSLVHETVVNRVLLLCIAPSVTSPLATGHSFMEDRVLRHCLSLLRMFTLASNRDHKISESWASLICQIFLENKFPPLPQNSSFLPMEPSSPVQQTRLISVLTHTLGAMARDTVATHASSFLPRLLKQAMLCSDEQSSTQSARCYASIVNKTQGINKHSSE
jgi:DNA repair/transcription protein MET18/MMS19